MRAKIKQSMQWDPSDRVGKFFAVDRNAWEVVCKLGLNCAVAYLVLAAGTGRDNRTTSWSIHAIEEHTGIGRDRAKKALESLIHAGVLDVVRRGSRPRYWLRPAAEVPNASTFGTAVLPEWVWLGNGLVTLAPHSRDDCTIIEAVRRTRSIDALRLLVHLHGEVVFGGEVGIEWRESGVRRWHDRREVGRSGGLTIWAFRPHSGLSIDPACRLHRRADDLATALHLLIDVRAVVVTPHLVDDTSYEGEVLHALPDVSSAIYVGEDSLAEQAARAAHSLVPADAIEQAKAEGFEIFVPVPRALRQVGVVGIVRPRNLAGSGRLAEWSMRDDITVANALVAYNKTENCNIKPKSSPDQAYLNP